MRVRITRVDSELPLPSYQTEGSVAFDIYSRENATVESGQVKLLPSNLIIEVPEGYVLLVASRSSTPLKKSLLLANGVGVIDQDYHGPADELKIMVYNFSNNPVAVKRGERIAQGMIVPVEKAEWDELPPAKQNSRGGIGSTQ
jgi:dUTP pyrophosphatase